MAEKSDKLKNNEKNACRCRKNGDYQTRDFEEKKWRIDGWFSDVISLKNNLFFGLSFRFLDELLLHVLLPNSRLVGLNASDRFCLLHSQFLLLDLQQKKLDCEYIASKSETLLPRDICTFCFQFENIIFNFRSVSVEVEESFLLNFRSFLW